MVAFKPYLESVKTLIQNKIEETRKLIHKARFMSYSEIQSEAEIGFAVLPDLEHDLTQLMSISASPKCIYNATPHPIHFMGTQDQVLYTIKPCGLITRIATPSTTMLTWDFVVAPVDLDGLYIPIIKACITEKASSDTFIDLPSFEDGVYYIVSAPVFLALPHRSDLLQVDPVRNEAGQTIGAKGFFSHASK